MTLVVYQSNKTLIYSRYFIKLKKKILVVVKNYRKTDGFKYLNSTSGTYRKKTFFSYYSVKVKI